MKDTEVFELEHMKEAFRFAKKLGGESRKSLNDCFRLLKNIRKNNGYKLHIRPDWVKHSFHFSFTKNGKPSGFCGGLILHGFQETLSVELTGASCPHWSLHT
jgi:hypothetical protein